MVSTCCVPSCKNKRVKQGNHHIRFYRIPKFNLERRAKWIKAIGRGGDWKPSAFSRVCSDHFVLGEKSDNKLSPNFVPCIFSHTTVSEKRTLLRLFDIHNREVAETTKKISAATIMLSVVEEELIRPNCSIKAGEKAFPEFICDSDNDSEDIDLKPAILYVDGQFVDPRRQLDSERGILSSKTIEEILKNYSKKVRLLKNEKGTQTVLPHDYIKSLEQECSNLRSEMSYFKGKYVFKNIEIEKLVDADDKIKYLTGLESYRMLKVLNDTVNRYQSEMFKLTGFQQLLMTLMKMRLGLTFPFLSILFDIEAAAVAKLFISTVELLFNKVVPLMITWPNNDDMKRVLPEEFIDCANCLYVVDCFEITVIGTSDVVFKDDDSDSLNNYGSDRTLCIRRYFMAIAPQGSIIFISKGRNKEVRYRTIIIESGFLVNISAGDALVTERELNIDDEIDVRGALVKMSSNVKSKGFSDIDEDGSRGVVRIKWVAHSLRQRFQVLDGEIPLNWVKSSDRGCYTILDKIVHVSCALFNMTNKVWTYDKFFRSSLANVHEMVDSSKI